MLQRVKYCFLWLYRLRHSCGFGIQSPTDYAFVRYVVCERWPYYHYSEVGKTDGWLNRRLGRLYFRLANWRQPSAIDSNLYHDYLLAGCRRAVFAESDEMIVLPVEQADDNRMSAIYNKVNDSSMLVIDGLWRNKSRWRNIVSDCRSRVTFDLYYCGIVFFDSKRIKQHYIINF